MSSKSLQALLAVFIFAFQMNTYFIFNTISHGVLKNMRL